MSSILFILARLTLKGQNEFFRSIGSFFTPLIQQFTTADGDPIYILGIFEPVPAQVSAGMWRLLVGNCSERASECWLDQVIFCKCKGGNKDEFLLFRFRWKTTSKVVFVAAIWVSTKAPTSAHTTRPHSDVSIYTSPCGNDPGRQAYFTKKYGSFNKLCKLDFPSPDACLSPHQVTILLDVVSHHSPNYDRYYWFANTIFDALSKLFPSSNEICCQHERRSRYPILDIQKQDSVDAVCEEYLVEWQKEQDKRQLKEREGSERKLMEETRRWRAKIDAIRAETDKIRAETDKVRAERERIQAELDRIQTERAQSQIQPVGGNRSKYN